MSGFAGEERSLSSGAGAGAGAGSAVARELQAPTGSLRRNPTARPGRQLLPGQGLGLGAALGLSSGLGFDFSVAMDDKPILVTHRLYLGALRAAFNVDALHAAGVTHILNLSNVEDTYPGTFKYMTIYMRDCQFQDLYSVFTMAAPFIRSGSRNNSRILIHCNAGRSRSPAIIVAYLMLALGWELQAALDAITAVRPSQCINSGFMAQLEALELAGGDFAAARKLLRKGETSWELIPSVAGSVARPLKHNQSMVLRRIETT